MVAVLLSTVTTCRLTAILRVANRSFDRARVQWIYTVTVWSTSMWLKRMKMKNDKTKCQLYFIYDLRLAKGKIKRNTHRFVYYYYFYDRKRLPFLCASMLSYIFHDLCEETSFSLCTETNTRSTMNVRPLFFTLKTSWCLIWAIISVTLSSILGDLRNKSEIGRSVAPEMQRQVLELGNYFWHRKNDYSAPNPSSLTLYGWANNCTVSSHSL